MSSLDVEGLDDDDADVDAAVVSSSLLDSAAVSLACRLLSRLLRVEDEALGGATESGLALSIVMVLPFNSVLFSSVTHLMASSTELMVT